MSAPTEFEQIRYFRYGEEPPEHAWYWNAVDSLAWLIGAALEAEGIYVVQTKEKFGRVSVYIGAHDDEDAALSTEDRRRAYQFVYTQALMAHPQLRRAILDGCDYPKLASGERDPADEELA